MPRRLLPIFLLLLGACAPLPGARGGPPGDGGNAANERPGAATSAAIDQQQAQLAETAAALKLTPRQLVLWESYQQKVGARERQLRLRLGIGVGRGARLLDVELLVAAQTLQFGERFDGLLFQRALRRDMRVHEFENRVLLGFVEVDAVQQRQTGQHSRRR